MRKILIYILLSIFCSNIVYSQNSNINSNIAITQPENFEAKSSINYDSIWCFHPFSINFYAGLWTPFGTLNDYYNPSAKLGISLGFMIIKDLRLEIGMNGIIHTNTNELVFIVNDSDKGIDKTTGASLGGWLTYSVHKDKKIYIDILSGFTWESIGTDIENPNNDPEDENKDYLSVSTYGISLGTDIWINKLRNYNLGLRILYCYAPYNNDDILKTNIGSHSISTSLIYRLPRRKQKFRDYY